VPTTSTSDTLNFSYTSDTAASYGYLTILDNNGLISGTNASSTLRYDISYTRPKDTAATANTELQVVVPHAACADGTTCYTVTDNSSTFPYSGVVTGQTAVTTGSSAYGVTIYSPGSSFRLATGGTVSFLARFRNQFKVGVPNVGMTMSYAGRNGAKASTTVVTDASGYATFTFADTGTAGTTDTVTFTAGTSTANATITYGSTTAGSVVLATPSTYAVDATAGTPGSDLTPTTYSDIYSGDGAQVGKVTVTALVKDANGVVMSGIPVTFSVAGTGAAVTSNTVTSFTGADGTTTASVYAWKAGKYVVTATAGGKSATANTYWSQQTATEARKLAVTTTGNSVVATVTDRFGNPIAGVPLKANRVAGSGVGNFAGSSSATGTTDENGQVEFVVSGGSATVKVGFNPTDTTTTLTYGQSDALKGLIDGVDATNTFTATTTGTSLTAEVGVGATYADAGVNSASIDVVGTVGSSDAVDAANEATDAANAATDAANAAAEAADAATAAAQDAQAAVAALASQVADLIAGIKAQITALTNLVIKIQKKVKA